MEEQKFVVKEVTGIEEKSTQEIEASLLAKHDEDFVAETSKTEEVEITEEKIDPPAEINDESILSYIKEDRKSVV